MALIVSAIVPTTRPWHALYASQAPSGRNMQHAQRTQSHLFVVLVVAIALLAFASGVVLRHKWEVNDETERVIVQSLHDEDGSDLVAACAFIDLKVRSQDNRTQLSGCRLYLRLAEAADGMPSIDGDDIRSHVLVRSIGATSSTPMASTEATEVMARAGLIAAKVFVKP